MAGRRAPGAMKLALVYNAQAGSASLPAGEIVAAFARAGHEAVQAPAEGPWERFIAGGIQRVIIAGGDGTVGMVLPHLAGARTPFCVLPCGTANNIARSLGQVHGLEEIVSGIARGRLKPFDLGCMRTASEAHPFVEAVGLGLFVELMKDLERPEVKAALKPEGPPEQELATVRGYLSTITKGFRGVECRVSADGEVFAGRFLLVEATNMKFIGPNLALAPTADPGDGWLDLVLVRDGQREAVLEHLDGLQRGQVKDLPAERRQCREVVFHELASPLHVDDEIRETAAAPVRAGVQPEALTYVDISTEG